VEKCRQFADSIPIVLHFSDEIFNRAIFRRFETAIYRMGKRMFKRDNLQDP